MAQLTVDLSADKATLARIAQFILQFAGYEPPAVATQQGLAGAANMQAAQGAIAGGSLLAPYGHLDQGAIAGTCSQSDSKLEGLQTQLDAAQVFGQVHAADNATQAPPRLEAALDVVWPPAAVVPPPPPPAGIDVDLRGLPWDPRIHASTRAKTAEGNWRQKRNVDPELMTKVEAELRATMSAPSPLAAGVGGNLTVSVPLPPVVTGRRELAATPPVPPPVPPAPFAGNAAPPAPPLPSGIPSVPASAGAATGASRGDVTFPQLMGAITHAFTVAKTLTKPQVDAAVAKVGLNSLPMLASRPDLVATVATELGLPL